MITWVTMMYSCMRGQAPLYLVDFFHPTSTASHHGNNFDLPADDSIVVPRCRLNTTARRAYSVVSVEFFAGLLVRFWCWQKYI